ncbi:MAG TPA: helix-turn-helix domain-containing protein [Solirubrobacteraceae bacterium]|nr:helix-turn-helix domain-containing protein [Solirubrobacteraceae bacterium]
MLQTGAALQDLPRGNKAWTPLARALTAAGDRWTLMIVLALAPGRTRLTALHRRVPGVSTGVLERHLQHMVALDLVTRTRFREMPPRVELELTDAGRELLAVAGMLARWGMRNHWSPPAERERIDVGALLRMLPVLLEDRTELPDGAIVEALVESPVEPLRVVFAAEDGELRLVSVEGEMCGSGPAGERADERHDAHADGREDAFAGTPRVALVGDEQAWIAALAPAADYSGLRLEGEQRLAEALFERLPREELARLPQ